MLFFWYDLCRYPKNIKILVIVNSYCFVEKMMRNPNKQTQNPLKKMSDTYICIFRAC